MFCLYITLRQHCFRLRNVDEVGLLMFWKWSFSPRSPCLRSPLWQQVLRRGHSPTGSGGLGRGNRLQSACRCVVLEVSRARWSCRPPADPEAQRSSDSRLSHSQLFKQRTSAISMWPTVAWRTDTNCTHTSNDPRLRHTHTHKHNTRRQESSDSQGPPKGIYGLWFYVETETFSVTTAHAAAPWDFQGLNNSVIHSFAFHCTLPMCSEIWTALYSTEPLKNVCLSRVYDDLNT